MHILAHNTIHNYSMYPGSSYAFWIQYLTGSNLYNNNFIASQNGIAAYI
ncbi:MAG: hypothetical protein R2852_04550 [Bacteroidia bacterium]